MNKEQKRKENKRAKDRKWFKKHLPEDFLTGLTIHHSWNNGEFCFLISLKYHRQIDEIKKAK